MCEGKMKEKMEPMTAVYSPSAQVPQEDGELVDYDDEDVSVRNEHNKRPRENAGGMRNGPRPGPGGRYGGGQTHERDHSRYHFKNYCKLRKGLASIFELSLNVRKDARNGRTDERTLSSLIDMAAEFCTCANCGKVCANVTPDSYVAPCGHLLCKPVCMNRNRRACPLCPS